AETDRASNDERPAPRGYLDEPGHKRGTERQPQTGTRRDRTNRRTPLDIGRPGPDAAVSDWGERGLANPEPEPGQQHRRKARGYSGRHLRRRPYRSRKTRYDMRAPAVDQTAAGQHHQHISPQKRREQIPERDRREPEFLRDRLPRHRHIDTIDIGDEVEQEQQKKDPVPASGRLHP